MTRLIDMYAAQHDITESRVVFIDAEPTAVVDVLERLSLSRHAIEAAAALGLGERIVSGPALIDAVSDRERVYGLQWQLDPGHVNVVWDVRVEAAGADGTMLSCTRRFTATDAVSRERLLAAWGLLGPLSATIAKRAFDTVKRCAEDDEHDTATTLETLLLAAA